MGTGRAGDAWRYSNNNTAVPDSSNAGNVGVTYTQPTSKFVLTYWNAQSTFSGVDRNQGIFITDLTFSYASTSC